MAIPCRLLPVINEARQTIAAQHQAITMSQASLANLSVWGFEAPTARVPTSAAPGKRELEMSLASFRSWKGSMECWLRLCKWLPQEAVYLIRLHCVPVLQHTVDARFTLDDWGALTHAAVLDAISKLVLRSSTQVIQWS